MQEEVRDRRRERLVRVAVADNTFTGEMLRDQLREAGIPSMLRNREGGVGVISGPGGTFELFVLEGDAARASTVLGGDPPPESLPAARLPAPPPSTKRRRWWR